MRAHKKGTGSPTPSCAVLKPRWRPLLPRYRDQRLRHAPKLTSQCPVLKQRHRAVPDTPGPQYLRRDYARLGLGSVILWQSASARQVVQWLFGRCSRSINLSKVAPRASYAVGFRRRLLFGYPSPKLAAKGSTMKSAIGSWVGTEIVVTPIGKIPSHGKAIRIDETGILLEPKGSTQQVFYPVSSILSVTGTVQVKKRKIGGA
jgi:hypothetical protein